MQVNSINILMNFKDFVKNKLVLQEVSYNVANKIPAFLQGVAPFDHIFGDKKRIVEPMKKVSEYHDKIRNSIIEDYELDFEKWIGYKITDKDKKNPIRIGKLLSQRKQAIERYIKDATNKSEIDNYTILGFQNQLGNIDKLLKVTNLQQAYLDAQKSSYYVIYSRMPIDVVRMSDHQWTSCHSEGNDYFYCALADASLNAGIAYVVTEEDLQKIDDLQKDEIFKDSARGIDGIIPQARIRIRSVYDEDGNSLAVPSLKVYKNNKFTMAEDFKTQVIDWAKRQDTSNIDWENTLTLRGGSYEDWGTEIDKTIKDIWGKDISYEHNKEDESDWEDDVRGSYEQQEEHWWDEQRDEFNPDPIYEYVFGLDSFGDYFDIEYDINGSDLKLAYIIPGNILEKIKSSPKWGSVEIKKSLPTRYGWEREDTLYASIGEDDKLHFVIDKHFSAHDYGEYYGPEDGGHFRDEKLRSDVQDYFVKILTNFVAEAYMDEEVGFTELRMLMNKTICDFYDVEYEKAAQEEVEDLQTFVEKKGNTEDELGQFIIPSFVPQIEAGYGGYVRELVGPMEQINNIVSLTYEIYDKLGRFVEKKYELPDDISFDLFSLSICVPEQMTPRKFGGTAGVGGFWFRNESTKSRKPVLKIDISINQETLDYIIDHGIISSSTKALIDLRDQFEHEYLEGVKTIFDLEDILNKLIPPSDYEDLKKQGQMELDLSSINRDMTTKFDAFIKKIFQEGLGNMGQGGLSQRGGAGTSPSANSSSTAPKKVAGGVQMQFSKGPTASKTPTGTSSQPLDYGAILNDPTAFELFQSDPNNIEGFRQHMADPKNFKNLEQSIKDPKAWTTVAQLLASPQQ
jgi:hypothetical protein